jgi:hypothetical protein
MSSIIIARAELLKVLESDWRAGKRVWRETTEDIYDDEFFGALPIHTQYDMMVSGTKMYGRDDKGGEIRPAFLISGNRYFACLSSVRECKDQLFPRIGPLLWKERA